ncbi:MAG TPA: chaperone NapD [Rhodopila sp.]
MSEPGGHISSAIVTARPEDVATVATLIAKLPHTEVHARSATRIVVVMEAADSAALADRLTVIAALPRVLAAMMVFEQVLNDESIGAA